MVRRERMLAGSDGAPPSPNGSAAPAAIRVARCSAADLQPLEAAMPSQHHWKRYAAQETGEGEYLLAWLAGEPAGHLLLRWNGSTNPFLLVCGQSAPYVEALAVAPARQSQGVGAALMRAAEAAARGRGQREIGLAVGVSNQRAQDLYRRLGYRDGGFGQFEVTWTYVDGDGRELVEGETCVYLTKRLRGRRPRTGAPAALV